MNDIFRKPFAYGRFIADASESRICFGIAWFYDEETANEYSKYVRENNHRYNGGWYHDMLCGRDYSFDTKGPDGRKLYAVTH